MANKFTIVITAVDKATAVVKAFKDRVTQITRPVRQVMGSFKKFGKELGLGKLAKGFTGIAKWAAGAAASIFSVGGALTGLTVAASVAAVANMARDWANAGVEVLKTAGIIGIGTTRLQSLGGAARLFGLDAKDMAGGLQSIGTAMEDAIFGRNQEALVMMNRLHITLKRTKDGAIDTAAGLLDVSRAIIRIRNVQAQALVARTFGVEGLLPMLQKGPAAIAAAEAEWRRTNAGLDPDALRKSAAFYKNITLLTGAVEGLGNSLANRLLPFLTPATAALTDFIEKSSEAINKHKERLFLQKNFLGNSTPGKPGGLGGQGGWFGLGINPFGRASRPNVWDTSKWFDFSDVHKPGSANHPPEKNTTAYDAWLAAHPHRQRPSQMPAFDPNERRPGRMEDLVRKHRGDIDAALADYANNSGNPDRLVNKKSGAIDKATLDFIRRVHADPQLMASLRGAAAAPAAAPPGGAGGGHVTVHFANAPAGMRVTQKPGAPVVPLRIDYGLPELSTP